LIFSGPNEAGFAAPGPAETRLTFGLAGASACRGADRGKPLVGQRNPAADEKFPAAISRDPPGARLQGGPPSEGER